MSGSKKIDKSTLPKEEKIPVNQENEAGSEEACNESGQLLPLSSSARASIAEAIARTGVPRDFINQVVGLIDEHFAGSR